MFLTICISVLVKCWDVNMKYDFLASGSKGNCFVLQDQEAVLIIDCGTTKKYLKSCFDRIKVDYLSADALLITHNHRDHISQIKMFCSLPIYSSNPIEELEVNLIRPYHSFYIRHLKVTPIPLSHDSPNTIGFIIESEQEKLVYITDTGYVKEEVLPLISDADFYIMESNHDVAMLMKTSRPYILKARILSDSGHLSNESCGLLLNKIIGPKTKEIVLAHISEEANTKECALQTVISCCKDNKYFDVEYLKAASQVAIISGGEIVNEKDNHSDPGRITGMESLVDA